MSSHSLARAMQSPEVVTFKSFPGASGAMETYLTVTPEEGGDFEAQLGEVETRYRAACDALNLDEGNALFRRIFVSDAINQSTRLQASELLGRDPAAPVAVSVVQQKPLPGRKIALLAYHVAGEEPLSKQRSGRSAIIVERHGRRHLWATRLCASHGEPIVDAALQTRRVFGELIGDLAAHGASLRENCLRTWIYLKNVDTYYAGMVEARREIFAHNGMAEGHSIASTGIEGACADRYDVVSMDAYANLDLVPDQVRYLNDFARLCPTRDYNVDFERATRIAYADRAHIFISGTASIDASGQVVHQGSVTRQLDRALENVEALLLDGGAQLSDLMHLIVYLRDPADHGAISAALAERFQGLPVVIVEGAVCRPQWLVEVEGVAVARHDDAQFPPF